MKHVTLALSSLAVLVGMNNEAQAGISNTKHNLTLAGNANRVTTGAGTEICVFCHTPHGADTSAPVPLWNKRIDTTRTYTTYASLGSSTLDSGATATNTGSISLACLSCHDGAQAMDNIINGAGALNYDTSGGGTTGLNYTWNTTNSRVDSNGVLLSSSVTNIGRDLQNDHPIGIQYCGGITATPVSGSTTGCNDTDFNNYRVSSGTAGNSDARYYVDSNASATKDKSDMILYTRNFPSNGWRPSVECASCHDPHVETKASTEVAFLRKSQASSGLCLACHNK